MNKSFWNKDKESLSLGFWGRRKVRRTILWAFFILLSTLILSIDILPEQTSLKEGDIAQEDVYYRGADYTYISQIRTNEAKNKAASKVEQVYHIDGQVLTDLSAAIDEYFMSINRIANNEQSLNQQTSSLREVLPGDYHDATLQYMLSLSESERLSLRDSLKNIISAVMQPGVMAGEIGTAKTAIRDGIRDLDISTAKKTFLIALAEGLDIEANKEYDAVATAAQVEEILRSVEPVQVTVQSGEKIISRGAKVSAADVEMLKALGMQSQNSRIFPYLGVLILVCVIYTLIIVYIRLYHPQTRGREANLVLMGTLINFNLLLCKLLSLITISYRPEIADQVGFLFPLAASSMLLAVLLGRGVAIFITVLMGVCVGLVMDGQLPFAAVAIVGGLTGIFRTSVLNQRGQFVSSSLYIAGANMIIIGAWGLINNSSFYLIGIGMLLGLIGGILSSILAVGILPFLESAFRITTVVRMLELSNSNHPLLKRLMMEAPGTYHHSILVGNLAEAAAEPVGADPQLVRAASYYHDIGKLRRPYFFIENQQPGENPHDKLQPTLSTLVIASHVKDGVEMLREYKFPEEIIDIVEQHHGTCILSYFYHKAKENAENPDEISKEDFRYPGPRPQTKEAALVMLADSVQAAVQSIDNPGKGQIEQIVREVVRSKMEDEQLQDCHLTFKDLEKIIQTFTMVLGGLHHARIVYPEQVVQEMGKYKNGNGNSSVNPKQTEKNKNKPGAAEPLAPGGETDHQ